MRKGEIKQNIASKEKKTPTIIIIDDENSEIDYLKLILEKYDLSVFTSENYEN